MKIAVLDDYQRVAQALADWAQLDGCTVDFFHDPMQSGLEVVSRLAAYDAIVAMRERTRFPAEVLRALPHLRLIVTTGMINRSIDLQAARDCGIVVCGTPWSDVQDTTVEVTWGLILSLAHWIPQEDSSLRAGRWQSSIGQTLKGKTLGIVGLGRIGSEVARIGLSFGMKVIAFSPHMTAERAAAAGAEAVSKIELFQRADVVSIHLILSESTRGIVNAAELDQMKPTALLVNTARGPLVEEQALANALRSNRLGGAAVDVFDCEPITQGNPLLQAPNTILTPHIGYVTREIYRAWYSAVVEDIQAFSTRPIRVLT